MKLRSFFGAIAVTVIVYGCSSNSTSTPTPQAPADFIAGDTNLVGVTAQWSRVAGPYIGTAGPDGSFLGAAHRSSDTTVTRTVYARNNFVPIALTGGKYPVGTMLVKYFRRRTDSSIVAGSMMVKRGGEFVRINPVGWEWINLSATTGTIGSRFRSDSTAANCINCHRARMANDYVFSLK